MNKNLFVAIIGWWIKAMASENANGNAQIRHMNL
jgi:hypothetical protein